MSDDDEIPEYMIKDPKRKREDYDNHGNLIIKMLDGKFGYVSLMKRLKKKWEFIDGFTLTNIGHEYFILRFSCLGDYKYVLPQGPWMLDDNYLTIRKWVPNFIPDDTPLRFLTAWYIYPIFLLNILMMTS